MNRIFYIFTLISISLSSQLSGQTLEDSPQHSKKKYVFKLNDEDVIKLYQSGFDDNMLHTLVDSFAYDSGFKKELKGHFFTVWTETSFLHASYWSNVGLSANILNNSKDLLLQLRDSSGSIISDADVTFSNQKIPYNNKLKCYQKKIKKAKGSVLVKHKGELALFNLDQKHEAYSFPVRKWRWIYKRPYRYVSVPFKRYIYNTVKHTVLFPYDCYRTIRTRRWQGGLAGLTKPFRDVRNSINGYPRGWFQNINCLISPEYCKKTLTGNIIFNQPMYRQGDTLRFKALFWNNGKPWSKRALAVFIHKGNDIYNKKKIATIHAFRKGSFSYEFVLTDSLGLKNDEQYAITLQHGSYISTSDMFTVADYELNSTNFAVENIKGEYYNGDSIKFIISAKDQNELPVFDARAKIKLSVNHIVQADSSVIYYPAVLWQIDTALSASGETEISIPLNTLTNGKASYNLGITCQTSDNETHTINETFVYGDLQKPEPKATLLNNSWLFELKRGDESISSTATLTTVFVNGTTLIKKIQLPHTEKLRQNIASYLFEEDSSHIVQYPDASRYPSNINLYKHSRTDSVAFTIDNPRQLLFTFQLYKNKKLIAEGSDSVKRHIKMPKRRNTAYLLRVQYVWGGISQSAFAEILPYSKKLQLSLENTPSVIPGSDVELEIKVTNHKGKPVKNADLLAFGYNAKFEKDATPSIPLFQDLYSNPKNQPNYNLNRMENNYFTHNLKYKKFANSMKLGQNEFYHFLYPEEHIYKTAIDAKDSTTQFAPYILKNGKVQAIYSIFIGYIPVFFGSADVPAVYSIRCDEKVSNIRIRYEGGEALIKEMQFEKGKKTILSIDADGIVSDNILIKEKPKHLTDQEADVIKQYTIAVEKKNISPWSYITQYEKTFHLTDSKYWNSTITCGPVFNSFSTFVTPGILKKSFTLETRGNYTFDREYFKIAKCNSLNTVYKSRIPAFSFKDRIETEEEILLDWYKHSQIKPDTAYSFHLSNSRNGNNNRLIIDLPSAQRNNLKFFMLWGDNFTAELRQKQETVLNNLPEGNYHAVLFFHNSLYYEKSFEIKNNYTTYIETELDSARIQKYTEDIYGLNNFFRINNPQSAKNTTDQDRSSQSAAYTYREPYVNAKSRDPFGKGILIKGTVIDEMGPLIEACVVIKGTSYGTVTDFDGQYAIYAPSYNSILVFSYVGLGTVEKTTDGKRIIDAILKVESKELREAVVIGYGVQKKEDLTVAITTVRAEEISDRPLLAVDQGMRDEETSALTQMPKECNGAMMKMRYEALQSASGKIATRTYFSDCAFWEPRLITDKNGIARFKTSMPGNITSWKTFFVAKAKKTHTGISQTKLNSFKPLVAEVNVPLFMIEGDSCGTIAKTKNYLGSEIGLTNEFKINDSLVLDIKRSVSEIAIDTVNITAANTDSIKISYTLQTADNYSDGEIRKIPVLQKGTIETIGHFASLDKDTTVTFIFDSTAGPVTIYAESDDLNIILREAEHIGKYEYLCNEQLASKLKALLVQERLHKLAGSKLDISKQVDFIVQKLNKRRNSENLWGWWAGDPTHWRFSEHIVEALVMAEQAGYEIKMDLRNEIAQLATTISLQNTNDILHRLILLRQIGFLFDYEPYIQQIDSAGTNSFYEHLQLISLKQKLGLPYSIDTLLHTMHEDVIYGAYWGRESYFIFDNSPTISALAYQIIKDDSSRLDLLPKIKRHLFHSRKNGHWNNTFESAEIITVLSDEITESNPINRKNKITIDRLGKTITEFPYAQTLTQADSLTFTKTGSSPLYLTAYQQKWNKNPEPESNIFTIKTNLETMQTLQAGKKFNFIIELITDKEAEYVMVEIPIPASCTYLSKPQSVMNGHIEYFNNKICIYIPKIYAGKQTFSFELMPRFSGKYTVNPAKAELMYFPTNFGRNGIGKVSIKQE